jgi:hypothetical protein
MTDRQHFGQAVRGIRMKTQTLRPLHGNPNICRVCKETMIQDTSGGYVCITCDSRLFYMHQK